MALSTPSTRWPVLAFCVCLVLLPLPLGSARPWALALTLPLLCLLGAVMLWRQRARPTEGFVGFLLRPPGLCLLAFLAVLALQLAPLPEHLRSIDAFRTSQFLLVALGCALAFWLVTAVVKDATDLRLLLLGLVASAVLQATIAVFLLATGTPLEMADVLIPPGQATGTFVNRNHLAGYLNMGLAAGIGLMAGALARDNPDRTARQRLRDWLELMLSAKARLRLLLVLIVIALILTRSRMGNGSFMVALLLAATVYWWRARSQRRGMALFVVNLLVIDLVLIGAWVGVDKVVQRVQETRLLRGEVPADAAAQADGAAAGLPAEDTAPDTPSKPALTPSQTPTSRALAPATPEPRAARPSEESLEDRVEPVLEARTMIADNPWLGTGGGTFNLAFLGYAPRAQGYYSHAHNDYLEIASDTGLPGMAALLVLALAGFRTALRILRDRRNEVVRAAAFAALMSITCMALHSLVDFNLQVPSNAITFSVMVALPFAAAAIPSGRSRRRSSSRAAGASVPGSRASGPAPQSDPTDEAPPSRARAALGPLLAGATIVLLGYVAFTAVRYGMTDLQAIRTNERGAQLQAAGGPPSLESLRALEALVAPVIALAPEAADYREMLGGIHFTRAALPDRDPDLSRQDYAQAAAQYRLATVLSRRSGYAWGNLLLAKHRAGEIDDEFNLALGNAARFAPYELNVQLVLVEAGLSRWDRLPPVQREQVAGTVARGLASDRDALLTEAAAAPGREKWCAGDQPALRELCKALAERRPQP